MRTFLLLIILNMLYARDAVYILIYTAMHMFPPLMGVLLILQRNPVRISYNYHAIFIYCGYCKQNYDDGRDTFKANRCFCFALILYLKKSNT